MILNFKNNVEARVEGIYQWETYSGLMEGLPTKKINKKIIKEAIFRAKNSAMRKIIV